MSITSTNEFQSRKMNSDRSTLTNPIYWWIRKIIIHDNLLLVLLFKNIGYMIIFYNFIYVCYQMTFGFTNIKGYQYLQIILGPCFMTLALWRIIVASDWIDFYGTLNNDAIFVVLFDYFWKICLTYLHVNIVRSLKRDSKEILYF